MTMRKNWTMRAAVLLLALVLISSCFVGGTFAKYVTAGNSSDTARVAKFGVTITANGTMFAKEYDTDDKDVKGTITQSVVSSGVKDAENDTRDNLVAPGTEGNMTSVTLSGTPEVAVEVKYTAEVKLENWVAKASDDAEASYYCPLKITVGDTTYFGMDYASDAEFAAKVKEAIDGYTAQYKPNTDLSKQEVKTPVVSWAWDFNGDGVKQTDVKDTYLGDQAAKDNAAKVTIAIATTVTQID